MPALQELTALLRKANRSVRQSALIALDALAGRAVATQTLPYYRPRLKRRRPW